MDVHRVQGSCGFSIPIFDYVSERDILKENFAKKDNDQAIVSRTDETYLFFGGHRLEDVGGHRK